MLERIEENCLEAVASLRGIVQGMHEDDRMGSDLVKFVSAGIRQRLESRDIDFDCRIRNRRALRELGDEPRTEIEKVLEELVSNTLKHSGASRVRLRLSAGSRGVLLRFSDDGAGFEPAETRAGSFGLANVRFRVERLGGKVSVRSAPGRGFEYSALLPSREVDHEDR
jgi:signal transduction histidine kinase